MESPGVLLGELLCFVTLPLQVVRVYLLRYNFGEGENPVFNA